MSLQSQLNNDAFSKLPKAFAEMQKAKGSMEQQSINEFQSMFRWYERGWI